MAALGDFSNNANDTTTTAKLDLDLNSAQVGTLQQIANLTNQIAVNSSAAARFTADQFKYLQQVVAVQRQINSTPAAMASGNGLGIGAGALGLIAGIQSQTVPAYSEDRTPPPAPASTPSDTSRIAPPASVLSSMSSSQLQSYNNQLGATTPASFARQVAQNDVVRAATRHTAPSAEEEPPAGGRSRRSDGGHGASPTRSEPEGSIFDRLTEYLEHGTRIAGGIQTAASGGQLGSGLVRLQQALNFGSLASIAAPVGAAAVAYEGYHVADEGMQSENRLGQTRGGGFGAGVGYQMQVSQLALNPFLTNEQSREIVMAGLNEGYSGKEFDSVTKFMAPQPLDEPVLTPNGWRKMGELSVGDHVVGSDGHATEILEIHEQGELECFEVVFDDGTSTRCADEHLWTVGLEGSGRMMVRPLKEIRQRLYREGKTRNVVRWFVPLVDAVEMNEPEPLPIDPYLLGLLLGDGSFGKKGNGSHVRLHTYENEDYIFDCPLGVRAIRNSNVYDFGVDPSFISNEVRNRVGRPTHPMKLHLEKLGLLGTNHHTKFVPEQYLHGSIKTRTSLLQGLIDTDGHISRDVSFANTNPALIEAVVEIIRSLGGVASVYWKINPPSILKNGYTITPRKLLGAVNIKKLPEGIVPARLSRKATRYKKKNLRRVRGIVDVRHAGFENMRCISISNSDGLYVTKDYILTHNSNLSGMNLQVADSVKLLQTNIDAGNQSLNGLSAQLGTLKTAASGSNTSLGEMSSNFVAASSAGVESGMSGTYSGQVALTAQNLFQNDPSLKGMGTQILTGVYTNSNSAAAQIMAMKGMSGNPDTLTSRLQGNALLQASTQLISQHAAEAMTENPQDPGNTFGAWYNNTFGANLTHAQAVDMVKSAIGTGSDTNPLYTNAIAYGNKASGVAKNGSKIQPVKQRDTGLVGHMASSRSVFDSFKGFTHTITGAGEDLLGTLTGDQKFYGDASRQRGTANEDEVIGSFDNSHYNVAALENQYKAYGGNLQYIDSDGTRHNLDSSIGSNSQLLNNITTGKYKLIQSGANMNTASTLGSLQNGTGFANASQLQGANITGQLQISLTAKAEQILGLSQNPISLTEDKLKANSGLDNMTSNTVSPYSPYVK